MRFRLPWLLFVTLLLGAMPSGAQAQTLQNSPFRVIGYFASYAIYNRPYFVTDIPADKLTHINYAFAMISEAGEVELGDEYADVQYVYPGDDEDSAALGNFHQLELLKDAHLGLKTLISIGGWTDSGRFSDVALTAESRAKFARSAVDFAVRYGFDGIDIDWEYPTGDGESGNAERPEDPANFALLLAELRSQLDEQGQSDGYHYLLTIATNVESYTYDSLDWAKIHPLLDWINVMTYDISGDWSDVTGFSAPLYASPDSSEGFSSDGTLMGLLARGIPADKLVMGVPFYGYGWSGVAPGNNGLHQPFTGAAPGTEYEGTLYFYDLAANYVGSMARFWDDEAKAPWLYDAGQQIMISYDDAESVAAKANYVREHGFGGIMFWELSLHSAGALETAIFDALNAP